MKPKTSEALILGLIRKHSLARVEIVVSTNSVTARAIPDTFNPVVSKRREEAFAAATGSLSMKEAEEITRGALAAVAQASGASIGDAVCNLEERLVAG